MVTENDYITPERITLKRRGVDLEPLRRKKILLIDNTWMTQLLEEMNFQFDIRYCHIADLQHDDSLLSQVDIAVLHVDSQAMLDLYISFSLANRSKTVSRVRVGNGNAYNLQIIGKLQQLNAILYESSSEVINTLTHDDRVLLCFLQAIDALPSEEKILMLKQSSLSQDERDLLRAGDEGMA